MLTRVACGLALLVLAVNGAACAPVTLGAHSIQPSPSADATDVWIYLQTSDADQNGIYRCYDADGKPVCKKARMVGVH